MKHNFLKIIIYCNLVLLCGLLHSGGYTYADQSEHDKGNVNELKNTIQKQAETISQLQAEIKKQQKILDELKPDPVKEILVASWPGCAKRDVTVKDGLVQVSFLQVADIVYFFDSNPEQQAHSDLAVFLNAANLKQGTIEYLNGSKKLFSITGSATSAKTKNFY